MSKWSAWPCDEIKDLSEIRQRHARDEASSSLWERNPYVMHRDREWLLSEVKRQGADIEKLREAMTDMLAGWRYIRETYGDLAGIGWDRAESKARNALEGKP